MTTELKVIPNSKVCSKCKHELSLTEFHPCRVRGVLHVKSRCKTCTAEDTKIRYESRSRTKMRSDKNNRLKKTAERKLWFHNLKNSLKCSKCPESRSVCLDFHHIDISEKDYHISYMIRGSFSKEYILREISKCIVLCANCHRIEHADG
jgi:hypothetical protein